MELETHGERPVFVLGCARSGTTLLQLMLHSHPRIAVPPETRFVQYAYRRRRQYGDLREAAARERLARWITTRTDTRFHHLKLDTETTIQEIVAGPPTLGSAIATVFQGYARRFDKPRWGDKRPAYFMHIPELLRMFPNAQFVHIIRDGRDCVGSMKQMPWFTWSSYTAMSIWGEAINYGRWAQRRYGSHVVHQLRYEDLIADPDVELRALCGFLGEDFAPQMCEPHRIADTAVPKKKTWHANTRKELTNTASGAWQQRLEPWEIELCEHVLGSRLRANGYELTGASRPEPQHLEAYTKRMRRRRKEQRIHRAKDLLRRFREPTPEVANQLEAPRPTPVEERTD